MQRILGSHRTVRSRIACAAVCRSRQRVVAFSVAAKPAFRVLGLQQVAIGGLNKASLSNLWMNLFGLPRITTFKSEKENVDEDVLQLGRGVWSVELDLMQPLNPNKSPKVHDPALNHIGLWVDDIQAAVKSLSASGVRFTPGGIRKGASGHDVCFIHPKGNAEQGLPLGGEGVLIELVQAPKEVIEAFEKEQPPAKTM